MMYMDTVTQELFPAEAKEYRQKTEQQRHEAERLRLAAQNLLNSPDGKLVLYWLINQTGVFTSSFTGNSTTFFNEGKRAVGLAMYQLLMSADPQALQKLVDFRRGEVGAGAE